ncbi:hypothetical protein FACS189413_01740 [Bacteroidia bacterium]|nr:hypothetical protein FACS189413_01740 [Bacteroidia bacterium]
MAACWSLQAQNVAFLKTGGTNGNGKSPSTPTTSINTAYKVLEDAGGGGTIVLVDGFTISSNFMRAVANTQNVTLTSVWDGVDYREGNPNCALTVGTAGFRYSLNGPHTFENITFKGNPSLTANYIMFIANFHPLTMGEGISVVDFPNTQTTTSCTILGGIQNDGSGSPTAVDLDANIIVKSGTFIIVGFNRQKAADYTGTAHIDIQGGEIIYLYGGSLNNGHGGNVDLNISGGTFIGGINVASGTANLAAGSANVTISGGNFTNMTPNPPENSNYIFGGISASSKISVYAGTTLLPNLPAFWSKINSASPFTQQEIIIPANITATADMYNWGDIVFESNETSTGQLTGLLTLGENGVVKIKKSFAADKWYAIGFPFNISSVRCDNTSFNYDLETYDENGINTHDGLNGDYWLKTYDGDNFYDYAAGSKTIAAGGYVLQVPDALDGATFTFTSESGVVLNNSSDFAGNAEEYTLTNNPLVANQTLTQGSTDIDDDYYRLGAFAASNFGRFSGTYTLKPFESVVVAKGIATNALRASLNIETPTAIDLPSFENLEGLTPVAVQYYNLQGVCVGALRATPLQPGIYIVKTIYASGKSEVSKVIIK